MFIIKFNLHSWIQVVLYVHPVAQTWLTYLKVIFGKAAIFVCGTWWLFLGGCHLIVSMERGKAIILQRVVKLLNAVHLKRQHTFISCELVLTALSVCLCFKILWQIQCLELNNRLHPGFWTVFDCLYSLSLTVIDPEHFDWGAKWDHQMCGIRLNACVFLTHVMFQINQINQYQYFGQKYCHVCIFFKVFK